MGLHDPWPCARRAGGRRRLAHYELRQDENGECALRFIPDATAPTEENLAGVTARLESLLKLRTAIKAEAMTTLGPAASGKFRLTCRVAAHLPSP